MTLRLVFDTNVMVAALRSTRGASRALLTLALGRDFVLLMSVPLMIEYEAVLTRAEHMEAAGASPQDVHAILDALASVIEPVRLAYLWRPVLPDQQDDMVLETAANGQADWLVTLNLQHFKPVDRMFGIEVLLPGQAVARLRR